MPGKTDYTGFSGYHPKQILAVGASVAGVLLAVALGIGLPITNSADVYNQHVQPAKAQACAHSDDVGGCLQKAGLGPQYIQYGK